jgi:hypothetical protein
MQLTELAFLEDLNALISETIEEGRDPWQALKTLAQEVRERIGQLEDVDNG